jgi:hypothetical protein
MQRYKSLASVLCNGIKHSLPLPACFAQPGSQITAGQAKKEGLATIMAVALALECLGENAEGRGGAEETI